MKWNSFNVEVLAGTFNQEKALLGTFSVIANLRMYHSVQLYYLPAAGWPDGGGGDGGAAVVAAAVPAVPGRALLRPAVPVPRPGVGLHREPAPHHAVLIADTRLIKSAVVQMYVISTQL